MPEDYAAKMALKTDAALREYVTGHYQYREEAVLAALAELRARGQPAPEEAALRPGLEAGAAARRTQEEAPPLSQPSPTPPGAAEAAEAAPADGPALYSPTTIVLFSVPFTMIAGGVLLGLNLSRLKRWRALAGLVAFIVIYLIITALALQWALPRYGLRSWYGPLFNFPAILAYVLWFWPRYVGRRNFPSRPWLPPLLVCLLLLLGAQRLNSYLIKRQPPEVRQQFERLMPD
ncbi:hypothetical protein [uncultured Hymenobacter sp.]|uniref:hypothetical protein n=1 Tax=uncultured Hymenobacter sp. TaxID=170016 RepID=UPI0035CB1C0D